jgi:hypothetical protein
MTLFAASLCVFAVTRLVRLESFPIYFFTDEAIQSVQAAAYVQNHFRDAMGDRFPTFFQNYDSFNLSVSVYAQIIPYELFGFSVFATRATSVLVTLSGMVAVGLTLRDFLKIRFWWVGVLLLAVTPAWFLHSRTAFETALGVSFYAWFLYFYLRYRYGHRFWLFAALLFGALTFYAYNPLQIVVVATGATLLLSDLRYHWRNWRIGILGVLFLVVLAVPYLRFQAAHPDESYYHLRTLDSYWLHDISLGEKLDRFWHEYSSGLSPTYWYDPDNSRDLVRHQMKGYGNILLPTLPFAALGALLVLLKVRSSAHRAVIIATLAAPLGAALVGLGVTRALVFVIPAAMLTAIGVAAGLSLAPKRIPYSVLALGLFALLSLASVLMLRDALANGPTWYRDYGLYGMQYGARQVFGETKDYLKERPQTQVLLSPVWANGADTLLHFFLPDEPRVHLASIDGFNENKLDLNDNMLFVMTPDEYRRTVGNPKFTDIKTERVLPYPDGRDGFYFVRLRYSPDADAILAAEIAARRQPVHENVVIDGQTVDLLHSPFDAGQAQNLFDGDVYTLVRTMEANPAVIELTFPEPRPLTGVTVTTGSMDLELKITVFEDENTEPAVYDTTYRHLPADPTVEVDLGPSALQAKRVRIEVRDMNASELAKVHVREIKLH